MVPKNDPEFLVRSISASSPMSLIDAVSATWGCSRAPEVIPVLDSVSLASLVLRSRPVSHPRWDTRARSRRRPGASLPAPGWKSTPGRQADRGSRPEADGREPAGEILRPSPGPNECGHRRPFRDRGAADGSWRRTPARCAHWCRLWQIRRPRGCRCKWHCRSTTRGR